MMNKPTQILLLLSVTALPLVGGISWLVLRPILDPAPSLDEICALARARRFDQAQALLLRYLRTDPNGARPNLLMAQFATDRPDPQPDLALNHLRRIQPDTPARAAIVRFTMGKAHYQQSRYDLAESCWTEALRLDPTVPEAGWALFNLFDVQGRVEEAHVLGLRLYEVEPDPRDRVRLLLALARLDIDKPSPESQAKLLAPLVRLVPENLNLAISLGLALIHDSRGAEGLEVLRDALNRHPKSPEAWDAWLTGLNDAGRPEELAQEFARLPKTLANDVRFAKHEGQVAQGAQDWPAAASAFGRAFTREPYNGVLLYRLSRAVRLAGDKAETERVDQLLSTYQSAFKQLRGVVDEALAIKTLGLEPQPGLYQRLADLREQMGRPDEARAWHHLVLRDDPGQALSLAALERLE